METDGAAAAELARRLCVAMEAEPVVVGGGPSITIRISAGVAALPEDAPTSGALVDAADKALYAAKARGRNRAVTFAEAG